MPIRITFTLTWCFPDMQQPSSTKRKRCSAHFGASPGAALFSVEDMGHELYDVLKTQMLPVQNNVLLNTFGSSVLRP